MLSILLANKPSTGFLYLFGLAFVTIIPFFVIECCLIPWAMMLGNFGWGATAIPLIYVLYESNIEHFMTIPLSSLREKISKWLFGYLFFPFAIMILQVWGQGEFGFGMVQVALSFGSMIYLVLSFEVIQAIFVSEFIKHNKSLPPINDFYNDLHIAFLEIIE